uniref:PHF7 protein n=1 Tax=Macrostomum lignano TaxID=282301 RepID=A0A1I8FXY4_9PLAT
RAPNSVKAGRQVKFLLPQKEFCFRQDCRLDSLKAAEILELHRLGMTLRPPAMEAFSLQGLRCQSAGCGCDRFSPDGRHPRQCDTCQHGWIYH